MRSIRGKNFSSNNIATVKKILSATHEALKDTPPDAIRLTAIAEKLDMSHANLYRYFADKQAIFEALLANWLNILEAKLQIIVQGPDPADDKLERLLTSIIRAYMETIIEDEAIFNLLANPDLAPDISKYHRQVIETYIEKIIDEGSLTRLFSGGQPKILMQFVLDITFRFLDPATLLREEKQNQSSLTRRDKTIRCAIRAISSRF